MVTIFVLNNVSDTKTVVKSNVSSKMMKIDRFHARVNPETLAFDISSIVSPWRFQMKYCIRQYRKYQKTFAYKFSAFICCGFIPKFSFMKLMSYNS